MIITVDEKKVITEMFSGWCSMENAIDWSDEDRKAQIRCAITTYSHHIQNLLADVFTVNQEEGEE